MTRFTVLFLFLIPVITVGCAPSETPPHLDSTVERLRALRTRANAPDAVFNAEAFKLEYAAILSANTEPVRLDQYEALHDGISYAEATAATLHLATELSRVSMGGTTAVVYQWMNRDGSNITATFQNDRLVAKAQFGLQ